MAVVAPTTRPVQLVHPVASNTLLPTQQLKSTQQKQSTPFDADQSFEFYASPEDFVDNDALVEEDRPGNSGLAPNNVWKDARSSTPVAMDYDDDIDVIDLADSPLVERNAAARAKGQARMDAYMQPVNVQPSSTSKRYSLQLETVWVNRSQARCFIRAYSGFLRPWRTI